MPSSGTGAVSVRCEDVGKRFSGGVEALRGVDLELRPGSITALVGPSGCGKTTLLRLVGGLERPTAGRITSHTHASDTGGATRSAAAIETPSPHVVTGSAALRRTGATLGFCFQDARLLPWRSVLANVGLPLELAGVSRGAREGRAQAMIDLVGLADAADRLPRALSGGMKMRAALARALVVEPSLLLLDEPFGAVDELTRRQLDDELLRLHAAMPMTILLVTHSIDEAAYVADRVVVMGTRPGRIVEVFDRPDRLAGEASPTLRGSAAFVAFVEAIHGRLAIDPGAARDERGER